jgi:hypothetical protein
MERARRVAGVARRLAGRGVVTELNAGHGHPAAAPDARGHLGAAAVAVEILACELPRGADRPGQLGPRAVLKAAEIRRRAIYSCSIGLAPTSTARSTCTCAHITAGPRPLGQLSALDAWAPERLARRMPPLAVAPDLSLGGKAGKHAVEVIGLDLHRLGDFRNGDARSLADQLQRLKRARVPTAAGARRCGGTPGATRGGTRTSGCGARARGSRARTARSGSRARAGRSSACARRARTGASRASAGPTGTTPCAGQGRACRLETGHLVAQLTQLRVDVLHSVVDKFRHEFSLSGFELVNDDTT